MIIITGGAGFIGSQTGVFLNEKLSREDLLIVDSLGSDDKWKNLNHFQFLDYFEKEEFIRKIEKGDFDSKKIDCLFHFGACSSTTETDLGYLIENNYKYSQKLFNFAAVNGIRFIYASSAATYGDGSHGYDDETPPQTLNPLNGYGFSKQIFDLWIEQQKFNHNSVGLKFFNVYGPGESHKKDMSSVIFKAFNQIQQTGRVNLFKSHHPDYKDGEQLRDFIYVKDAVKVAVFFMMASEISGIFNVGTGKSRSFYDLVASTFQALDMEPKIDFIDMPESIREKYQYFTEAKMRKIRDAGYKEEFYSLEEGVKDYIHNYLSKGFYI